MDNNKSLNPALVLVFAIIALTIIFLFVLFSRFGQKKDMVDPIPGQTQAPIEYIDPSDTQEEPSTIEETGKVIPPTIDVKRVQKYLMYRLEESETRRNILDTPKTRLEIVEYFLMEQGESKTTTDTDMQPSAYTSRTEFESKYKELFGSNYSIGSEINDLVNDCTFYRSLNGTNNICWNNAWGSVGPTSFTITYKKEDSGELTYKGTYEKTQGREMIAHGTFEFKYSTTTGSPTLKSIILIPE